MTHRIPRSGRRLVVAVASGLIACAAPRENPSEQSPSEQNASEQSPSEQSPREPNASEQGGSDARVMCANRDIEGAAFAVCRIPPALLGKLEIASAPRGSRGVTIAQLDSTLRTSGRRLGLAMNAGIFGEDGRTLGLLVSGGRTIVPLNRSKGPRVATPGSVCDVANFYCPPNGVFVVHRGAASILTTSEYARRKLTPSDIQVATQSGPMLVAGGKVAREFPVAWRKRIQRNAVCTVADGAVQFVLAQDQTHRSFAEALRGPLGCRDALYLDGSISDLYTGTGAPSPFGQYGAILYLASTNE